ncbi:hypothetical protein BCEN4_880020 [Burkholderia cenocepacia]|nr:hypothetical protein BCEN4_880020 [Burkholderia cenocepacia]
MPCLRVSDVKTSIANYPFGRPPNVHYTWCQLSSSVLDIVCAAGENPSGTGRRATPADRVLRAARQAGRSGRRDQRSEHRRGRVYMMKHTTGWVVAHRPNRLPRRIARLLPLAHRIAQCSF